MRKLLPIFLAVACGALMVGVKYVEASSDASVDVETTAVSSDGVEYTYTTTVTYTIDWFGDPAANDAAYQAAVNQATVVAGAVAGAISGATSSQINEVANSSQAMTEALAAQGVSPPDTSVVGTVNSGNGWSATNAGSGTTLSQQTPATNTGGGSGEPTPPPTEPPPSSTPIDGGWSVWSACSATACGTTGTQTRTCTNPPPSNGGASCTGPSTQSCSTLPCCTSTCDRDDQVCAGTPYTVKDSCGKDVICTGTRSCDYNWKEVAP